MPELSRRNLIRRAAAVTGAAVVASVTPAAGALAAAPPRRGRHGDLRDIKHVVILMQENRSFDHYFGSLRGVRGFGDRSTITLPGGYSVWQQPTTAPGQPVTGTQYPWRLSSGTFAGTQPPSPEVGAQNYGGTDHSWESQHGAWYGGLMNAWYYAKGGPTTLGYLSRAGHPVPLRPRGRLHDRRRATTARCSARPAPTAPTCGAARSTPTRQHGSFVAYSGGDELGQFLPWPSYPETLRGGWRDLEGLPGQRQLRRQRRASTSPRSPSYDPAQGGTRRSRAWSGTTTAWPSCPSRIPPRTERRQPGPGHQEGRAGRHPAAGVLGGHQPAVLRAPGRRAARRRLLRQPGAPGAQRRPGRVQLHPGDHRLRRERRPVRPRPAAGPGRRGPRTSSTWRRRWPRSRCRSASASGCRCCWSRRGPGAAG